MCSAWHIVGQCLIIMLWLLLETSLLRISVCRRSRAQSRRDVRHSNYCCQQTVCRCLAAATSCRICLVTSSYTVQVLFTLCHCVGFARWPPQFCERKMTSSPWVDGFLSKRLEKHALACGRNCAARDPWNIHNTVRAIVKSAVERFLFVSFWLAGNSSVAAGCNVLFAQMRNDRRRVGL